MLRIALPNKGRLAEEVRDLFADAGLEVRARGDRALVASLGGEFEAIFVRSQDIPEFVADGAADAGVTGWDLVCESDRPLDMLLDLEFGRCRLVVAARDESGIASLKPDPVCATRTEALVLPGVGAFAPAAERLAPGREALHEAIDRGLPCLGICLGMQLLFEGSEEGPGDGLGVFTGRATRLRGRRVPQIGWSTLDAASDPLLDAAPMEMAYYANAYVCRPAAPGCVGAWSEHDGDRFPAIVRRGRTVGVQFHPEKSSWPGVQLVRAFLREARIE